MRNIFYILLNVLLFFSNITFSYIDPYMLYGMAAGDPIKNHYIVQLKDGTDIASHISAIENGVQKRASFGEITEEYSFAGFLGYSGIFDEEEIEIVKKNPVVKNVYSDVVVLVNSPDFSSDSFDSGEASVQKLSFNTTFHYEDDFYEQEKPPNWGLSRISSNEFSASYGHSYFFPANAAEGINIFIMDTGINISHPEFEGRASYGFNAILHESDDDLNGHGTNVAGIAGSRAWGVAKKASIISVKVMTASGFGSTSAILSGLQWISNNYKNDSEKCVINYSIGSPIGYPPLASAQSSLVKEGFTFVVAAGNNAADACKFNPCENPDLICVGNIDQTNNRYSSSNFGECVDIWAPGTYIRSANNNGIGESILSGTSQASSHVSGVAALYLSQGVKPQDMKKFIHLYSTKNIITTLFANDRNEIIYNNAGYSIDLSL